MRNASHRATRPGDVFGKPLTAREDEVLAAYARAHDGDGRSRDAVAAELHISPNTVATHLVTTYRKLGVKSNVAAFRARGWLAPPPPRS